MNEKYITEVQVSKDEYDFSKGERWRILQEAFPKMVQMMMECLTAVLENENSAVWITTVVAHATKARDMREKTSQSALVACQRESPSAVRGTKNINLNYGSIT